MKVNEHDDVSLVLSGPTVTFHPIVNTWFRRYINFCYIYEQREVSGKSLRILSLFTFAMKPSTMLPFWLSRSCLSPATSSSPLKLNGRQCWELNPPQRFGDAYVIATRKGSSESNGYVREGTDSNGWRQRKRRSSGDERTREWKLWEGKSLEKNKCDTQFERILTATVCCI